MKKVIAFLSIFIATVALAASVPINLVVTPSMVYVDGTPIDPTKLMTFTLYGAQCDQPRPLPLIATSQTKTIPRTPAVGQKHCYAASETVDGLESSLSPELVVDLTVKKIPSAPSISLQ